MRPAASAALLLALTACGPSSGGGAASNTLRLALINDPILNPVIAPDVGSILVNKVLFPGLVRPDEQLRPSPDLATSWTISDDGREYTFALRHGVTWHDGTPFSSRDVQFTFERILDSTSGSLLWSDFAAINTIETPDSFTVRFKLKTPFAAFLTMLGYNAGIVPEHAFRSKGISENVEFNRSAPIGTGPFRVTRSVPGSSITLEAYPGYYGEKPKLAGITFKLVPEANAQVAALRAGELDFITVEPASLPGVRNVPGIVIAQATVPQHYWVGFNQRLPLFKPAAVRAGLGLAVNRRAIVDGILKGAADLPVGTIPVALGDWFDNSLPVIPYDTAEALRKLASAGWHRGADGKLVNSRGEPFRFKLQVDKGNPSREQAALAIQQDWKAIGVDASIETVEFSALVRDDLQPGKFDAILIWWTTPADPDQYTYYASHQINNNVAYANKLVDSLLLAGRGETDAAKRHAIYRALQAVELEDPPVLLLYYPREIQAMSERLSGMPALGIRDALRHSEVLSLRSR